MPAMSKNNKNSFRGESYGLSIFLLEVSGRFLTPRNFSENAGFSVNL
jgi:hypothetical protein